MAFIIRGQNDFYEGWLAHIFGVPLDDGANDSFAEGWHMADETPSMLKDTIKASVGLGQIKVDYLPTGTEVVYRKPKK